MVLIQVNKLAKSFGVEQLFSDVSFLLQMGDRIGLIGPNGTGKSTLLKIINGQEEFDEGKVIINQGVSIGYLSQEFCWNESNTLFQIMLEQFEDLFNLRNLLQECEISMSSPEVFEDETRLAKVMEQYSELTQQYEEQNGYAYESKIKGILNGLGFKEEEYNKSVVNFSGGQQTRISLAKLLLREPEVLLLDEPTNHLDITTTEWLEEYLKTYSGCVLIVSHDRYFLDRTVTKILDLYGKGIKEYKGSFSEFQLQKAEYLATQQKEFEKQQRKIAKLKAYIERNRAGVNAKQARGRETRLNKMELINKPFLTQEKINIVFEPKQFSGEDVCSINNLLVGYDQPLSQPLNLLIKRGEKVALIGANGTGKTTILKNIVSEMDPLSGEIKLGSKVTVGYFSQHHQQLSPNASVMDEIRADFPLSEEQARNILAGFLFMGDDVFKKVGNLSGGERGRLVMCKLFLRRDNFLVLDEPTNHLDIDAKESLEEIINQYWGTILFVSHDRYFIDQVADYVLELEEGRISKYLGDYTYYKWKKEQLKKEQQQKEAVCIQGNKDRVQGKINNKLPKSEQVEEDIFELEAKLEEVEILLATGTGSIEDIEIWAQEYNQLKYKLDSLYDLWEKVSQ